MSLFMADDFEGWEAPILPPDAPRRGFARGRMTHAEFTITTWCPGCAKPTTLTIPGGPGPVRFGCSHLESRYHVVDDEGQIALYDRTTDEPHDD